MAKEPTHSERKPNQRPSGGWNTLPGLRSPSTVENLITRLELDDQFKADLKNDPAKALAQVARERPLDTDLWVYRIVVVALGLTVIIAVVGSIVLSLKGVAETPQVLTALGSAAVGALAGLLAPPPQGK